MPRSAASVWSGWTDPAERTWTMIAGLVALLVMVVLAVVFFALMLAVLGLVIGGALALVVLAVKAIPLILLGWLAMKVLGGGTRCRSRRLCHPHHQARVSADDAWLDSRV